MAENIEENDGWDLLIVHIEIQPRIFNIQLIRVAEQDNQKGRKY